MKEYLLSLCPFRHINITSIHAQENPQMLPFDPQYHPLIQLLLNLKSITTTSCKHIPSVIISTHHVAVVNLPVMRTDPYSLT